MMLLKSVFQNQESLKVSADNGFTFDAANFGLGIGSEYDLKYFFMYGMRF